MLAETMMTMAPASERTVGGKEGREVPEKMLLSRMLTSRPMGRNLIYPHSYPETDLATKTMVRAAAVAPAPRKLLNSKTPFPREGPA